LPRGAVIAVARLVDVWPGPVVAAERPEERPYGDYASGRFGWMLEDVVALPAPFPLVGRQGLWNVPEGVAERLRRG
jgi:hypothetical protein